MFDSLETALENILKLPSFREQNPPERAINGAFWKDTNEGKELMSALSEPSLDEFENHLQLLGNGSQSITRSDLANWCVDRAAKVSPAQVVDDIKSYIASKDLEVFEILLLASVYIDTEYKFNNGVLLTFTHNLPNSKLAERLVNYDQNSPLPLPSVVSVLIAPYIQPRFHWPNTEFEGEVPRTESPFLKLQDTKRMLALVRSPSYGVHAIAHATTAPDHYPIIQSISGWVLHSLKSPPLAPEIIKSSMLQADVLLKKFDLLPENDRSKLRISIDRLNGYASGSSIIDRAIDLRICLESIFLNDGNKEQLRHTLGLRAARYIGNDLDERKRLLKMVKTAYDLTSTMVHTGKKPKKDLKVLDEAANLAKSAIVKIIENGFGDWSDIELDNV